MPLNANQIYNSVKSRVSAKLSSVGSEGGAGFTWKSGSVMDEICKAICEEIVLAIKTTAVVNVISVAGVKTGPGTSGPGTGTIS